MVKISVDFKTHSDIHYSGHFVLDEKAVDKPEGGFQVIVDDRD